jgi:hypothetical protein
MERVAQLERPDGGVVVEVHDVGEIDADVPLPFDAPTRCALSSPSASSSPTVFAAMSDSVHDADDRSPASAAAKSGGGALVMCVDSPASRLSKRITCKPRRASSWQSPSGELVTYRAAR